jgi:hypothetical protein
MANMQQQQLVVLHDVMIDNLLLTEKKQTFIIYPLTRIKSMST